MQTEEAALHVLDPAETLSDRVYIELVRSLYANVKPAIIMSGVFALSVALIYLRHPNSMLFVIGALGTVSNAARIAVVRAKRRVALTTTLDRSMAKQLEVAFAIPSIGFALCLGAFGAKVFTLAAPETHTLTICLLVGYCAGVATGAGLRPYIAVPSMAAAIFPTIIVSILKFDSIYVGLGTVAGAFFVGGAQTIWARSETVKGEIGKQLTFGSLARLDSLTALPNRLALREYFDGNLALSAPNRLVAVHFLDLDDFKPVNDRYGHATGDALLSAVAQRLNGAVRNGDIVARLGGDEFAILQFGLQRKEEAEFLAKRASAAIRQPFRIDGQIIRISACMGSVIEDARNSNLDEMLALADRELYSAKRNRAETRRAA